MRKNFTAALFTAGLPVCAPLATADEGMWLFNNFPEESIADERRCPGLDATFS